MFSVEDVGMNKKVRIGYFNLEVIYSNGKSMDFMVKWGLNFNCYLFML